MVISDAKKKAKAKYQKKQQRLTRLQNFQAWLNMEYDPLTAKIKPNLKEIEQLEVIQKEIKRLIAANQEEKA